MEIVELVPGVTYPDAIELPNRNRQWVKGKNKSSPSGNNLAKKNNRMVIPGKMTVELQKLAQQQTRRNQMVMVLSGGKRRWVRKETLEAG
jgi:hypothetical protein